MRIKSPFKDYYDGVMRHGAADDLLYLRYSIELLEAPTGWEFKNQRVVPKIPRTIALKYATTSYMVKFCDSYYQFALMACAINCPHSGKPQRHQAYVHSVDDMDKWVERFYKKQQRKWYDDCGRKQTIHWFENAACIGHTNDFDQFEGRPVPIWIASTTAHNHYMELNPRLAPFEFQRRVDPYTAYQSIYMWLTNRAAPTKEIPKMSDADMRDIKGFDKWSFKRPPSKRKDK